MRKLCIGGLALLLLLAISTQVTLSQVNTNSPVANRTVYIEPSYQLYIDQVTIPSPATSTNVTFNIYSASEVFSVNAYGPTNQSLSTTIYSESPANSSFVAYTINVDTANTQTFRLVTVIEGLNFATNGVEGNNTAYVNFFPILDQNYTATTTIYLPQGSTLIYYDFPFLSNSTTAEGIPVINGSAEMTPSNTTLGLVQYTGDFAFIQANSVDRQIQITSSGIQVEDTLNLINVGTFDITNFTFTIPVGASNLEAMDTVGSLSLSQNGSLVTVATRQSISYNEGFQISLLYALPVSMLKNENGKTVFSGNILPDYLNMPVDNASLTILLPLGSSNAQMVGGQIVHNWLSPEAVSSASLLIPYTNQTFNLTYTSSAFVPYIGQIILAIIIILIAIFIIIYFIRRRKKVTTAKPPPQGKKASAPQ